MNRKNTRSLPRRPFKIVGGFMEQAQKILELYQQIEKHIRYLEGKNNK